MKTKIALLSAVLLASTGAFAASPDAAPAAKPAKPAKTITYVTNDNSNELLLSKDAAKTIWAEPVPAKVAKAYSPKKFGFSTEVDGGFTAAKICVVTARVSLLPLAVNGKTMQYKPVKVTSTFDASTTATKEQCATLANDKLKEAIHAMMVALGG
jgi:hypothetical protein